MRPAEDVKRPNHRVKFVDEVEKKFHGKQGQAELPMTHGKIKPSSDDDQDTPEGNIATRTRSKLEPDGNVSSRTRANSGKRNLGHLNVTTSEEAQSENHFECHHAAIAIRNLPMFMLTPAGIWVGANHQMFEKLEQLFGRLGSRECKVHNARVEDFQRHHWEQLKCVHMLDQCEEESDDPLESMVRTQLLTHTLGGEQDLWDIDQVSAHRVKNGAQEVKCHWKDLN